MLEAATPLVKTSVKISQKYLSAALTTVLYSVVPRLLNGLFRRQTQIWWFSIGSDADNGLKSSFLRYSLKQTSTFIRHKGRTHQTDTKSRYKKNTKKQIRRYTICKYRKRDKNQYTSRLTSHYTRVAKMLMNKSVNLTIWDFIKNTYHQYQQHYTAVWNLDS